MQNPKVIEMTIRFIKTGHFTAVPETPPDR